MNMQRTPDKPAYYENFPLIDGEFDSFDLDDDLNFILRETQSNTLFHKAIHLQE